MRIAICDVGVGNIRSVERALMAASAAHDARTTAKISISRDPDVVRAADKVVIPGQGAFRDCARALEGGLGAAVREKIAAGAPYLGICLGLQVLFEGSDEAPGCAGLGVFAGKVAKLAGGIDATSGGALKIPHVGWNVVTPSAGNADGARFLSNASNTTSAPNARAEPTHFYFVHSYVVVPTDARIVAATTEYGETFVSAVAKDNVFACQFHPEKSQRAGLALLARFVAS